MSREQSSMTKNIKIGTFIFVGLTAAFSLLALFLWLFGAPGVENEYARGWRLGFETLYRYLAGCCVALVVYSATAIGSQKFRILIHVSSLVTGIFWIFFIYSAFNLYRAFQIMI
jgi:hypothetical protein